jgi:hypothetical protein
MPIETRWYLEGRVSFTRLSGVVTEPDLKAMDAWLLACMENPQVPLVHHIIDCSDITKPTSVRHAMQLRAPRHARIGWALTINSTRNPMVRFLTGLVVSAARIRYRDVNSFDHALETLNALDPSLPDLQVHRQAFEARPAENSRS